MKKLIFTVLAAAAMASSWAGDFELLENKGSLAVKFRGMDLIRSSGFYCEGKAIFKPGELAVEKRRLADGSTAYNIWSRDPKRLFRQEGVISADGNCVEINMQFDCQAYSPLRDKTIAYTLQIPFKSVDGVKYYAAYGRNMRPKYQTGTVPANLAGNLTPEAARVFIPQLDGGNVIFDFAPHGPTTYSGMTGNTIIGQWQVARLHQAQEFLSLSALRRVPREGGGISGKVVLMAGDVKKYNSCHPRLRYTYYDPLPAQRLYSFGAAKTGNQYRKINLNRSGKGDGWVSGNGKVITGKYPGAFYSAVAGSGKAVFKVKNLQPGYYFVTVGAGNFDGGKNKFSIKVNGETLADAVSVKNGEAASLTKVFRLHKGYADVEFSGDWRISTLGLQLLINKYEDFSFDRGFWVTDGPEPSVMFRNAHYAKPVKRGMGRVDIVLPDPGRKTPQVKKLIYTVSQPDAQAQKNMQWRYTARVTQLGPNNNGTFNEFNAPGLLERRIDEIVRDKFNVIIVSGLLSRHTFPEHLARARTMLAKTVAEAHKRNVKVYDHIDYILLWNMDCGFRVAAEKPQWLARELTTLLPTTDFCFNNHERNQAFRKYLKKWIDDTKLDGIMIDEVCYSGGNFCGCGDCRSDFTADTALQFPVNELAADHIKGKELSQTALAHIYRAWRSKKIGDWWVALRNYLKKDYPEFGFLCYTTHYGLSSMWAPNYLGSDLLQVGRGVDFLGTEIMPRNVWENYRAVFAYRKAKNMFRKLYNVPVYGQTYAPGGWDVAYFGWGLMNMNGQVYWAQPVMDCPKDKGNYYKFADRNMDISKAESCADVALIFSSYGRNNGLRINYKPELFGLAQTLGEMHVNYDILSDVMLSAEMLKNYKVLFTAVAAPMADEQIKVLRDFAAAGGTVVLGPISGIADQYGTVRKQWPFADIFKFSPLGKNSKVSMLQLDNGKKVVPLKPMTAVLPNPRNRKMPDAAVNMLWGKTRIPAILSKPYGKGTFIYMPLAAGEQLFAEELMVGIKHRYVQDENVAEAVRYLLNSILQKANAGTWQCKAPEKVLATLYKQGKSYYAHFLNASGVKVKAGDVVRKETPADAFPMIAEDITFTLPNAVLTTAEAASPDFENWKKLKLEKAGNSVKITLPKELLEVYTLVRIR